jgi:hypothetical protein
VIGQGGFTAFHVSRRQRPQRARYVAEAQVRKVAFLELLQEIRKPRLMTVH